MAKILRIRDIREFKNYCRKVRNGMDKKEFQFASYGDQDFKYLPSMFKAIYNIKAPTFSEEDANLICAEYVKFYERFQIYKQDTKIKNIIKLFVVIQAIIQ